jgi:predicted Fe-Mo cluster-binding NifX family protein
MSERKYIAVGSGKDEKSLWVGHFGISPFYFVYDDEGNLIEKRVNPYSKGQHHDDPRLIIKFLDDCKVFIAKRMGEESRKKLVTELNIETFLTKAKTVQEAIEEWKNRKLN